MSLTTVFLIGLATALATGLGALPFLLFRNIGEGWVGRGDALASGLMIGASVGLCYEARQIGAVAMVAGLVVGGVGIHLLNRVVDAWGNSGGNAATAAVSMSISATLIMVMTIHSAAEGVGVGVALAGGEALGILVATAIAVHNIPEGLAISLTLVPRGSSVTRAAAWSVFSSLPQPLLAVPAFLLVEQARTFLPFGLGFAAGAMVWVVFAKLLPEARSLTPDRVVAPLVVVGAAGMLTAQILLGA